jgi:4-amino-4-deoxy-L-arabinose transferase-like glycosyltransferase
MTSTRGGVDTSALSGLALKRLSVSRFGSTQAWGAGAVVLASIALTAWWLSVDRGVPYNDAAQHLVFAFGFHDGIAEGHLVYLLEYPSLYPPATYLLGGLAAFVGGVQVTTPIFAQSIVYVPLLALACYRIGRMTGGPSAGLLAVVFALGAPLMIEQSHVFMLDLPQAALVAVTAWSILASDRFARVGVAALAGLAFGVALETKQMAPIYLAGLIACVLARGGGWRNWRGLGAFLLVALLVGTPWYVRQLTTSEGGIMFDAAGAGRDLPAAAHPPVASLANLAWYFWATLDGLLFAPLFAIAACGCAVAVARVARTRPLDDPTLELLCGMGAAWIALSVIPHHDMRYTMGLIAYLAVLGTAWLARLSPSARTLGIAALVAAIVAAHLGATFGVGGETTRRLPGNRRAAYGEGVPPRGRVIVYSNQDYMVSGPHRRPDVRGVFEALRREGVTTVAWEDDVERWDSYFEEEGLWALARVANLQINPGHVTPGLAAGEASLVRGRVIDDGEPPCLRFADGSGLWVRVGVGIGQPPRAECPPGVR